MSDFPFDDIERLYREEDDLPPIPNWPSIFTNDPKPEVPSEVKINKDNS
jgi:hypothetical protein